MSQVEIWYKRGFRVCVIVLICVVLYGVLFASIAGYHLWLSPVNIEPFAVSNYLPEITSDTVVRQPIHTNDIEEISKVSLQFGTYGRSNDCSVRVAILNGTEELYSSSFHSNEIVDGEIKTFYMNLQVQGMDELTLQISSPDAEPGNAVTLFYSNTVNIGRANVEVNLSQESMVRVGDEYFDGQLCFGLSGWKNTIAGTLLKCMVIFVLLFCLTYGCNTVWKFHKGKDNQALRMLYAAQKYSFLMKQLVARDFNAKYKRSILGVLWSFVNPLLTMLVQYFVFSNLFKSSMEGYVVYLFSGIVIFSFFSEATNYALSAVVGNTALITKVYVPKYIYPISRVLSSCINLAISTVLLLLITFMSSGSIQWAVLLLPYALICIVLFSLGVGMLLSAVMVYFRDIQFLYGVLITITMYATPIFYPANILPESMHWLFSVNPIYHFITFVRGCLITGAYPGAEATLYCFAFAVGFLCVGLLVFKKTQNNFTFHL